MDAVALERLKTFQQTLHRRLIDLMQEDRSVIGSLDTLSKRRHAHRLLENLIDALKSQWPEHFDRAQLCKDILDWTLGFGALEDLLRDPDITEIMINGPRHVYVEISGRLQKTPLEFKSSAEVLHLIEKIVSPLGRRIDEASPLVDARLPDGSRVNAIIPPLALCGPTLTIRKFRHQPFTPKDLVQNGSLSVAALHFLRACVVGRCNILISGGTGTGKTTLLNLLAGFIPIEERIVTIEDAAELRLPQEHVVSLEARPANLEGSGEIPIRMLVKNALRMRPDRIVVGECRGGEALDMLQAMNTGHDGSLTTGHANDSRDMLLRLETMVLMSGVQLPLRAIREQIASALDLIIQIERTGGGKRRICRITEICGMEGDVITLQDLFAIRSSGGALEATGLLPNFRGRLQQRGVDLSPTLFARKAA